MANENEKRETVTDIAKELRKQSDSESKLATQLRKTDDDADFASASCYTEDAKYLSEIADRIEAAWKREREELERYAPSKMLDGATIVDNRGNAAEIREALEFVVHLDDDSYTSYDIAVAVQKARAALAAPARNCDMFNTGEPMKDAEYAYGAWQRYCDDPTIPPSCKIESAFKQWLFAPAAEWYDKFCDINDCRSDCPLFKNDSYCELAWAQMPYENQEGAGK